MGLNIDELETEKRNSNSNDIENLSTVEIIDYINREDQNIIKAVNKNGIEISKIVDIVVDAFNNDGRLIYLGAGTSGRLGILDASECPPTYGVKSDMVMGLIAGGDYAIKNAVEGAEDDVNGALKQFKEINLSSKDVVIGISASGRTPYVLGGLKEAKRIGCKTASIANTINSEIGDVADVKVEILVGPEVVTGSTRMKAGTSQKMVLNMITTTSMIKIGKIYKGYMVDVKPTNEKLIKRATRILSEITNINKDESYDLLKKANFNLKVAIVSKVNDISMEEANNLLTRYHMNIVKAINHKEN